MSALAAYEAALRDEDHCWVVARDGRRSRLPVTRWKGVVSRADEVLLSACKGLTLDVGCGPGRLTVGLAERRVPVLGIDVSGEAVRMARRRGASVMQGDFFDGLPGEGHWNCVLLADGNLGIGGDPTRLLRRAHAVLARGGRVVLDLDARVSGIVRSRMMLSAAGAEGWLDWAHVGPDAVSELAARSGLTVERLLARDRAAPFAVLVKQ